MRVANEAVAVATLVTVLVIKCVCSRGASCTEYVSMCLRVYVFMCLCVYVHCMYTYNRKTSYASTAASLTPLEVLAYYMEEAVWSAPPSPMCSPASIG